MTREQQIAALKAAIDTVDAAIAQTQAALVTATAQDKPALRAALVDLQGERARLKSQLLNLEAAAVGVSPLAAGAAATTPMSGGRATRALRPAEVRALRAAITKAALTAGKGAKAMAALIGNDPTTPFARRKKPVAGGGRQRR